MSGELSSWMVTGLIAVAIGVILGLSVFIMARRVRPVTMHFYCPWARREVVVQCLTCDGQHPISVQSCSAFAVSGEVTCGMRCVGGDGRGALFAEDRAPVDVTSR